MSVHEVCVRHLPTFVPIDRLLSPHAFEEVEGAWRASLTTRDAADVHRLDGRRSSGLGWDGWSFTLALSVALTSGGGGSGA